MSTVLLTPTLLYSTFAQECSREGDGGEGKEGKGVILGPLPLIDKFFFLSHTVLHK